MNLIRVNSFNFIMTSLYKFVMFLCYVCLSFKFFLWMCDVYRLFACFCFCLIMWWWYKLFVFNSVILCEVLCKLIRVNWRQTRMLLSIYGIFTSSHGDSSGSYLVRKFSGGDVRSHGLSVLKARYNFPGFYESHSCLFLWLHTDMFS